MKRPRKVVPPVKVSSTEKQIKQAHDLAGEGFKKAWSNALNQFIEKQLK